VRRRRRIVDEMVAFRADITRMAAGAAAAITGFDYDASA